MASKYKKKINYKLYIIGSVIIILIIIVSLSIKNGNDNIASKVLLDAVSPSTEVITSSKNKSSGFLSSIFKNENKDETIKELEKEIQDLREEVIRNKMTENELSELRNLKTSLNFIEEEFKQNFITASIVAKNDGNYYTSFTISAGENQGVQKDAIVLTGKGLVGKVYEVSANYSKVVSILDSKSSVSFEVLRNTEFTGIASQNINFEFDSTDTEGFLKGYLFDISYEVLPGDVIVTSGLGLYPEGIQIGEINEVIEDNNNLLKFVKIKPYANFKKLDKVMILNPRIME